MGKHMCEGINNLCVLLFAMLQMEFACHESGLANIFHVNLTRSKKNYFQNTKLALSYLKKQNQTTKPTPISERV